MEFIPNAIASFCGLSLLLVAGKVLRIKIRLLQRLYLPSSVIGGLLGLVVLQSCGDVIPPGWTAGWTRLAGILINVVFAALFLGVTVPSLPTVWRRAGSQLAYGQIVAWGQYVVGLGLVLLVLGPLFGTEPLFGVIIPVGFEGGHGTAGGLMPTFEAMGWREGGDYALSSATVGIVSAIVVGMALVNWAARKGMLSRHRSFTERSESERAGLYAASEQPSAGAQTVRADSIDSLALHLALIGLAVLLGVLIKGILVALELRTPGLQSGGIMRAFPLFPLCMIGGLVVQKALDKAGRSHLVDHGLMQRLSGAALDFLVVAAISTIRLDVLLQGIVPFVVVVAGGILWNVFCVMWLAKRLLPGAWFERAMAEMGQSMGVTATGLLLLRVVDPEAETEASSAFGYKQLLHEPFMGGGIWTSTAVLLVWRHGAGLVLLISVSAVILWLIVWAVALRPRPGGTV